LLERYKLLILEEINIKLGFDLDGTLASIDVGWLNRIRDLGTPEKEERQYYASRNKILDPYYLVAEGDEIFIITGRNPRLRAVTELWLLKNGLGHIPLIFTGEMPVPKGTNEEFRKVARGKAVVLKKYKIDVYFEDNETVVRALREVLPEIVIVQIGSRIKW
jgi:hypothetical protein